MKMKKVYYNTSWKESMRTMDWPNLLDTKSEKLMLLKFYISTFEQFDKWCGYKNLFKNNVSKFFFVNQNKSL